MSRAAPAVDAIVADVHDLIGVSVETIEPVRSGRNSRVFRVAAGGECYAFKQYPAAGDDTRDRLGTEIEALRLMQRLGVANVPHVIAADPVRRCSLLSWIDGAPVTDVLDADIDAAATFLATLHAMRLDPAGRAFRRPASEACLSGREVETQIRRRLEALRVRGAADPDLARFLETLFAPALETLLSRAARDMAAAGLDFARLLPQEQQSLVPSDFGFHNCLRSADGTLAFLDFEYFGWDDPVKLVADVLHHPGTPLAPRHASRFRAAAVAVYGGNGDGFAARLRALYPLFGLRWVLILLNEFLPDRWRQRVVAGEAEPWAQAKARQLARASALFARLAPIEEHAAHG